MVLKQEVVGGSAPIADLGSVRHLRTPYLVFLGDCESEAFAKTALGIRDWTTFVIGQHRFSQKTVDLGVPDLSPMEAKAHGARSFVIGVSAIGGQLAEGWREAIHAAIQAGLDIVSGLHQRLDDDPDIAAVAKQHGVTLHDVRHTDQPLTIATGARRSGHRLLTVGTDCALGKKYTALALTKYLRESGVDSDFRATGQTGVMIAGRGVAIDAVPADFIAGVVEELAPAAADDHWDMIEGQGSLFHPAYSAVSLGLLHGAQARALVMCHDPTRPHINGFPNYPMPDLAAAIARYEEAARLTEPAAKVVAISLNTSKMEEGEALALAAELEDRHQLPCMDVLRFGIETVAETLVNDA